MNFKKTPFKIIIFIVLLVFLFSAGPLNLFADTIENQINNIQKEKEETQKKLEDAKKEEEQYTSQVNTVEDNLLSTLDELSSLKDKLTQAKIKITELSLDVSVKEKEIAIIEEEIKERSTFLDKRAAEMYKRDNRSVFDVVFRAEGFLDFFTRLKMLASIVKKDAEIIKEIMERKKLLLETKKNILKLQDEQIQQKSDLESLIKNEETKKTEIEAIYKQKKELLTVATANKEALIAMENQLEKTEQEIARTLQSYSSGSAPSGKLLWPVLGKISSGFGNRRSYSGNFKFHAGLDIYAPSGSPVYAAETGQVIKAEYDGGYGYCILIYHGGNFATFYAHLSGFAISNGQYVQKGQIIGYVDFEVRIKGTPNNPINYF
ncbi:MAG: peptidoglycan DD-metalloendopeptidase family protein [Actinobacteria bacterium]|nr:peptidoglycan DD-metalloendopeptidase family protein [Actinomycetota bacterium]